MTYILVLSFIGHLWVIDHDLTREDCLAEAALTILVCEVQP